MPPPFNVDRFAKDSDAKLTAAAVAGLQGGEAANTPQGGPELKSERRLVTRPKMAPVATDEAWARGMTGSLYLAKPLAQLKGMPLDHRAAYLLSWMDGFIDLDTLVEVSTMAREEVLRVVRDLFDSGVVEFR